MYVIPLFLGLLFAALHTLLPNPAHKRGVALVGTTLFTLTVLLLVVVWYHSGGETWTPAAAAGFQPLTALFSALALLISLGSAVLFFRQGRLFAGCGMAATCFFLLVQFFLQQTTEENLLLFDRFSALVLLMGILLCLPCFYHALRSAEGACHNGTFAGFFLALSGLSALALAGSTLVTCLGLLLLALGLDAMLPPAPSRWKEILVFLPTLPALGSLLGLLAEGQPTFALLARSANNGSAAALCCVICLTLPALFLCGGLPFSGWLTDAQKSLPLPVLSLMQMTATVGGAALLLRSTLALRNTLPGFAVVVSGGLTFLLCSCLLCRQARSDRFVLWSGLGLSGLVVTCLGIGSPSAAWAALMLLLCGLVSQGLLTLLTEEGAQTLHTGQLSAFDGMLHRLPKLQSALLLSALLGCAFLPFGLLLSQWATLIAASDASGITGVAAVLLLCLGLAARLYGWAGLLMRMAAPTQQEPLTLSLPSGVRVCIVLEMVLNLLGCLGYAWVSSTLVLPAVKLLFGAGSTALDTTSILLMILMLAALVVFPLFFYFFSLDYETDAPLPEETPAPAPLWTPGCGVETDSLVRLTTALAALVVFVPTFITVIGGLI